MYSLAPKYLERDCLKTKVYTIGYMDPWGKGIYPVFMCFLEPPTWRLMALTSSKKGHEYLNGVISKYKYSYLKLGLQL